MGGRRAEKTIKPAFTVTRMLCLWTKGKSVFLPDHLLNKGELKEGVIIKIKRRPVGSMTKPDRVSATAGD